MSTCGGLSPFEFSFFGSSGHTSKAEEIVSFLHGTVTFPRPNLPDLWAQCGQRRNRMSQSEGNEINEWQVQKSA